ncbi:hypothetical protein ACRDU6_05320 [Mycolicibacterium sp. ELW1]|nr:hypothetical protein [Mycobacterium sp. ELW1]
MNGSRLSRSEIVAASVGASEVLASVFLVAPVATPQITTTPTSAEPG